MRRLVPTSLLAVLTLAACSSSSGAATATSAVTVPTTAARPATTVPTVDPCTYLSTRDVDAAFGAPTFGPGARRAGSGWIIAQCEWAGGDASVGLAIGSAASLAAKGVATGLAGYVADRRAAEGKQFTLVDLPGVGDGGYVIAGRAPTALVYKGDVLVQVTTFSKTGALDVKVASTLAALVLEKAAR